MNDLDLEWKGKSALRRLRSFETLYNLSFTQGLYQKNLFSLKLQRMGFLYVTTNSKNDLEFARALGRRDWVAGTVCAVIINHVVVFHPLQLL